MNELNIALLAIAFGLTLTGFRKLVSVFYIEYLKLFLKRIARLIVVAVGATSLIGCTACQQGVTREQPTPPWVNASEWNRLTPEQQIRGREVELLGRIQSYLGTRGYRFGPGAESAFIDAIKHAARDIQRHPISQQRGETEKAVTNLQTVLDTMILASRTIPNYEQNHYRAIGEETLIKALRKLCPLWPICDSPR